MLSHFHDLWCYLGHLANSPNPARPVTNRALLNRWAAHFSAKEVHRVGLDPHKLAEHAVEMTRRGVPQIQVLTDIEYRIEMAILAMWN